MYKFITGETKHRTINYVNLMSLPVNYGSMCMCAVGCLEKTCLTDLVAFVHSQELNHFIASYTFSQLRD